MCASLVMLNGTLQGAKVSLDTDGADFTVGRDVARDLRVDDDRTSRLHARIFFRAKEWHVEDCSSLNGTFVNSQPVQQTVLEPGDLLRIGQRLMLFVDASDENAAQVVPATLRSTTLLGAPIRGDMTLVEESINESMTRVVRDSAVLCCLAEQIHQHTETKTMVSAVIDALFDGIGADQVSVWLAGADGRLRCAGRRVELGPDESGGHVLASLAVERSKAFLIEEPGADLDRKMDDAPIGMAIGVPIRGQKICRGAIECHRGPASGPFSRSDLNFAVVVSHQSGLALENLEHRERLEQANEELRRRLASQQRLVGSSGAMQEVLDQVARVGPTSSTVLVLGESGTGKELVAHSIHESSQHRDGPYVAVNCAAFSESLLESELFGHEPGAFTGADRRHIGQFERAHRGTIFLDEVGELSLTCQAKLLRVLEGHPFERVGGQESIRVDVRMIAATHRDLRKLIEQGRFREDLYYRLRVIDVQLPPLRERGDDAVELASMFVEQFRKQVGRGPRCLSPQAIEAIRTYSWPGNIRELRNAVERAVVMGQDEELTPAELGLAETHEEETNGHPRYGSLAAAERRHIEYVLRQVQGNKTHACRILGIGRGTLYKKLEEPANITNGQASEN